MGHFPMEEGSRVMLTLGVHEVVNQHIVTTTRLDGGVLEGLIRPVAHILLAQRLDMGVDVVSVLTHG